MVLRVRDLMFHRAPQHYLLGLDKDPAPTAANWLPPGCRDILILLMQTNPLTLIPALVEEGHHN